MSARDRAWDCAFELATHHPHHLTPDQHILCLTTIMRAPGYAPLETIALAAMVLGVRQ